MISINRTTLISFMILCFTFVLTSCIKPDKTIFDDFNYINSSDIKLINNGWIIKNKIGGPGPEGCNYSNNNISFIKDTDEPNNKLLRLTAITDGTAKGTSQAEIFTKSREYLEGTYAARIKFSDSPTTGVDGAAINETFFTISPLEGYMDPKYSELDFEYLPNGGWGKASAMWTTSWHTFNEEPKYQDLKYNIKKKSYKGWHTVVIVVADGYNTFYIDGGVVAKHGPKDNIDNYYYPRKDMSISFNLWFIPDKLHPLVNSSYIQDVDWVYHERNTNLTPKQVQRRVDRLRKDKVVFLNTFKEVKKAN